MQEILFFHAYLSLCPEVIYNHMTVPETKKYWNNIIFHAQLTQSHPENWGLDNDLNIILMFNVEGASGKDWRVDIGWKAPG